MSEASSDMKYSAEKAFLVGKQEFRSTQEEIRMKEEEIFKDPYQFLKDKRDELKISELDDTKLDSIFFDIFRSFIKALRENRFNFSIKLPDSFDYLVHDEGRTNDELIEAISEVCKAVGVKKESLRNYLIETNKSEPADRAEDELSLRVIQQGLFEIIEKVYASR